MFGIICLLIIFSGIFLVTKFYWLYCANIVFIGNTSNKISMFTMEIFVMKHQYCKNIGFILKILALELRNLFCEY